MQYLLEKGSEAMNSVYNYMNRRNSRKFYLTQIEPLERSSSSISSSFNLNKTKKSLLGHLLTPNLRQKSLIQRVNNLVKARSRSPANPKNQSKSILKCPQSSQMVNQSTILSNNGKKNLFLKNLNQEANEVLDRLQRGSAKQKTQLSNEKSIQRKKKMLLDLSDPKTCIRKLLFNTPYTSNEGGVLGFHGVDGIGSGVRIRKDGLLKSALGPGQKIGKIDLPTSFFGSQMNGGSPGHGSSSRKVKEMTPAAENRRGSQKMTDPLEMLKLKKQLLEEKHERRMMRRNEEFERSIEKFLWATESQLKMLEGSLKEDSIISSKRDLKRIIMSPGGSNSPGSTKRRAMSRCSNDEKSPRSPNWTRMSTSPNHGSRHKKSPTGMLHDSLMISPAPNVRNRRSKRFFNNLSRGGVGVFNGVPGAEIGARGDGRNPGIGPGGLRSDFGRPQSKRTFQQKLGGESIEKMLQEKKALKEIQKNLCNKSRNLINTKNSIRAKTKNSRFLMSKKNSLGRSKLNMSSTRQIQRKTGTPVSKKGKYFKNSLRKFSNLSYLKKGLKSSKNKVSKKRRPKEKKRGQIYHYDEYGMSRRIE